MFKYIKWELKSVLKGNLKMLIIFGIIVGLVFIIPVDADSFLLNMIVLAYDIMLLILMFGAFLFGTIRVVKTFKKPTFLLESMISFPPRKILLAKYILAIILNVACALLLSIAISIVFLRSGALNEVVMILQLIFDVVKISDVLRLLVTLTIYSTWFTALVTFIFVLSKVLLPNKKGSIVVGIIMWYVLTMFIERLFFEFNINGFSGDLFYLAITILVYFSTVHLIENKLEIYN